MSNIHIDHIPERVVPGRRLGRHVEHDERSRAFGVVAHAKPIRSVQWERHAPIFDQGDVGSCTGNAIAGCCVTGPLFNGRVLTEDDAVQIYEMATRLDRIPGHFPPEDTGSSGIAAARAAQKMGLVGVYHHAFGLTQALQALQSGPVAIGINWYEGFDDPKGAHAELVVTGQVRGGHEMVLDGLDVENGLVHGCNSWGASWGNNGRFVMTWGTFKRLLAEDGDVVVPRAAVRETYRLDELDDEPTNPGDK
jgi:hypothetical protein